jgi:hypothetical protein
MHGRRAIPDDNLAYPVLITLRNKNGGIIYGSGFYIDTPNSVYLVTAKHVIFAVPLDHLIDDDLDLLSYSKYLAASHRIIITTSTSLPNTNGNVSPD